MFEYTVLLLLLLTQFIWSHRWSWTQPNATLFTICALVFGTVHALGHFMQLFHQWTVNKKSVFVFSVTWYKCKNEVNTVFVMTWQSAPVWCGWCAEVCSLSVFVCVIVLVVVDGGLAGITATHFSAPPISSHLSLAAEVQENHCRNNKSKMLDKIRSLSTKVKNQHEKCQCLRKEKKKDILKYTFIQSLCKIKQQNWSALPSTLALLPPFNSPPHLSTFCTGHRHDDSSLACCHLSLGQNPDYYGIGFIWLPWAMKCLAKCTEPISHTHTRKGTHNHKLLTWPLLGETLFPQGPLGPQTMA